VEQASLRCLSDPEWYVRKAVAETLVNTVGFVHPKNGPKRWRCSFLLLGAVTQQSEKSGTSA
jgi:hypothetical protein